MPKLRLATLLLLKVFFYFLAMTRVLWYFKWLSKLWLMNIYAHRCISISFIFVSQTSYERVVVAKSPFWRTGRLPYDLVYLHGYEIKLTSKLKTSKELQCISPIVFVKLVFLPFLIQVCWKWCLCSTMKDYK